MKVLITGGAGFIGSHIAQALCAKGAEVVIVDNLSLGALKNLGWRKANDKLELIEGDIRDEQLITRAVQGCTWVFHEAALPSVPMSVDQPAQTNAQNLTASLGLLIAARDAKVKRFVFASSSAIYGNIAVEKKYESLSPDPLSPYGLQKYASEKYAQLFHSLYGLETVCLRYFNVFGPRQAFNSPYSGVIAKFCTTMLQGKRPIIFGDGKQSRDFVFIDNVVNANLLAAERPAENVAGKVFNVAGGESINLLQLVEEINRLTGQNLKPDFQPERAGDVRSSAADLTAAQRDLGFRISVSWQKGLEETLNFYRAEK